MEPVTGDVLPLQTVQLQQPRWDPHPRNACAHSVHHDDSMMFRFKLSPERGLVSPTPNQVRPSGRPRGAPRLHRPGLVCAVCSVPGRGQWRHTAMYVSVQLRRPEVMQEELYAMLVVFDFGAS